MPDKQKIKGRVLCIICHAENKNKTISVFYDNVDGCVLSNLKKHMKTHDNLQIHSITNIVTTVADMDHQDVEREENLNNIVDNVTISKENQYNENLTEEISPVAVEINAVVNSASMAGNYENMLYNQICSQNIKMLNLTLKYNETDVDMVFRINGEVEGNVRICGIEPNGNCFFGAIAHHFYDIEINCADHVQLTKNLRENVVNYITHNINLFQKEISNRILARRNANFGASGSSKTNQTMDVGEFLCSLNKPGVWGGMETLMAISDLHYVNIIIFNEKGDCYAAPNLNMNYKRCIFLAYRSYGTESFVHYDSVSQIKQTEILACVYNLLSAFEKQNSCNTAPETVIIVD